jgi:hypothetical protein
MIEEQVHRNEHRTGKDRRAAQGDKMPNLNTPFWKVLSYVLVSLCSGAGILGLFALNRLDKLNDAMIENKTMLAMLINQQVKSEDNSKRQDERIGKLEVKQTQLETIIMQSIEVSEGITHGYQTRRNP